ncbi:MAG: hypothetical protein ACR652_02625 [Methylocystis sp.]|uniref:hypothetical protein n=1 Tax=Methylocystis sp. TaxID=1911079 RepID=UPI003DA5F16F
MSSFLSCILGDATPETLPSVEAVGAAPDQIEQTRRSDAASRAELIERRRAALASDEPDSAIKKIDAQIDALDLAAERIEVLTPRLHRRLGALQAEARRETLRTLELAYREIEPDLDRAMQGVVEPFARFLEITQNFDACGFANEARTIVVPPPIYAAGLVCNHATLEDWRHQREALSDARARAANPVPAPTPATKSLTLAKLRNEHHANIKRGTANGQDVIADVHSGAMTGGGLIKVSLTHDYARNPEAGFLLGGTPPGVLPSANPATFPSTIPAGTVLTVTAAEAAALVAVSAGTLV